MNTNLAILAYTLSESYRLKKDTLNEKKYLILSALEPMKSRCPGICFLT